MMTLLPINDRNCAGAFIWGDRMWTALPGTVRSPRTKLTALDVLCTELVKDSPYQQAGKCQLCGARSVWTVPRMSVSPTC